jgi:hypothetical protein
MPIVQERPLRAAGAHDQADRNARDHAISLGASGRRNGLALVRPGIAGGPNRTEAALLLQAFVENRC